MQVDFSVHARCREQTRTDDVLSDTDMTDKFYSCQILAFVPDSSIPANAELSREVSAQDKRLEQMGLSPEKNTCLFFLNIDF